MWEEIAPSHTKRRSHGIIISIFSTNFTTFMGKQDLRINRLSYFRRLHLARASLQSPRPKMKHCILWLVPVYFLPSVENHEKGPQVMVARI